MCFEMSVLAKWGEEKMRPYTTVMARGAGHFSGGLGGGTATEYAFLLALIVLVAFGAIASLGPYVDGKCATISNNLPEVRWRNDSPHRFRLDAPPQTAQYRSPVNEPTPDAP
jgi:Flp pilus assembly pilin Flp